MLSIYKVLSSPELFVEHVTGYLRSARQGVMRTCNILCTIATEIKLNFRKTS